MCESLHQDLDGFIQDYQGMVRTINASAKEKVVSSIKTRSIPELQKKYPGLKIEFLESVPYLAILYPGKPKCSIHSEYCASIERKNSQDKRYWEQTVVNIVINNFRDIKPDPNYKEPLDTVS